MKKLFVIFLISLLFIAFIQAEVDRGLTVSLKELGLKQNLIGKQYLVMIAIDKYEKWLPLKNPVKDAKEIKNILTSLYYIDEVIELYDKEATKANIMKLFEKLISKLTVTDSLLFVYAGHGFLDEISDTGFWIPVNGGTDVYAQENWLPNTQIRGLISKLKASHICLIADACFSGDILSSTRGISPTINNEYFKKAYERTSRQVLTSGASEAVPDRSEFCRLLKMALEKNKSPYLDPVMLYNEIRLGVKDTLPMTGNLKETGHQDGASFLLFLKTGKEEEAVRKQETRASTAAVEASPATVVKATESHEKPTQEKLFSVSSLVGWQDTGIAIAKGDHVFIEYVSGKWRTTNNTADLSDAKGEKNNWAEAPFPDSPVGCLLGRIGVDQPFVVGNLFETKEAERAGKLYLRINDSNQYLHDNDGSLKIQIVVNGETNKEKRFLRDNFNLLTEYEGRRYYLSKKRAMWFGANEMCKKSGGHLATILSAEENKAVISALKEIGYLDDLWLGGMRELGGWSWVTGEKIGFNYWGAGEPNNMDGIQDRVHIWSKHDYKWADGQRSLIYRCLLEME